MDVSVAEWLAWLTSNCGRIGAIGSSPSNGLRPNKWGQKGFNPLCQCVYIYVCIVKPDIQTIHRCSHTSIHTFIHTYIHTYMHACIHTHIHTHTHIFWYALILLKDWYLQRAYNIEDKKTCINFQITIACKCTEVSTEWIHTLPSEPACRCLIFNYLHFHYTYRFSLVVFDLFSIQHIIGFAFMSYSQSS